MYTKALVWPAVVGSMLYAWQTMNHMVTLLSSLKYTTQHTILRDW